MAIEVFNRQELKFVISRQHYEQLLPALCLYMEYDKHNKGGAPYPLHNLYIDTFDHDLIRRSLAKPAVYKEKIRIRSYSALTNDSMVFLEMKKRYKKITNKRRSKMTFHDALTFIRTGTAPKLTPYMNPQVIREFTSIFKSQSFRPTAYISYDRIALFTCDPNSDLRVTFDTNLTSRRFGSNTIHQLLATSRVIMEIKSTMNIPLWLVELLDTYKIYKQSFSKYGNEYSRMLAHKHEVRHA